MAAFIALEPWKKNAIAECLDKRVKSGAALHPIRLFPLDYQQQMEARELRAKLLRNIQHWIRERVRGEVAGHGGFSHTSTRDYHLVLQLCFDLDLPQLFSLIQTIAQTVAATQNWPWPSLLLLYHIF